MALAPNCMMAHKANLVARTAINMNLALAGLLAKRGLLGPEDVEAIERSVTHGFENAGLEDLSETLQAEFIGLLSELEATTAPALARVQQLARQTWRGGDRPPAPTG